MKLAKIESYKDAFKKYLEDQEDYSELYKYECLQNYRRNWDLSSMDLYEMFDNSFRSQISNSLWGGSVNSAKSVMLMFIRNNPEFVRSMFRDLYNEDKDLSLRVNRFSFHCDQMMDELPMSKKKPVNHKHNPKILSVYLSFHDPENFTIIDYRKFRSLMELLEKQDIPEDFEIERIIKSCRALYKILSKDNELLELHNNRLPEEYRSESNMLLVHDFYMLQKYF